MPILMELTERQKEVIVTDDYLLVTGGPGSGKTMVSILKAAQIAEKGLRPGQKILFVSFARASVSRVVEAIEYEQQISLEQKRLIDVETYHSFFWRILKTHGYLIGLPRRLVILTPSSEAVALSIIRSQFLSRKLTDAEKGAKAAAEAEERVRLAMQEGRVCFDLFAPYVGDILHRSTRIRSLIASIYPVIILDEFQDTNDGQWRSIKVLGEFCRLIALADPEQRIYEWNGADPARLDNFREAFKPTEVDLSTFSHRSPGTEIVLFGNELLTDKFRQKAYKGITIQLFDPFPKWAWTKLVSTTHAACKRLAQQETTKWTLAILVPTKKMVRLVSDALSEPPGCLPGVPHLAVIEMEAAILAAEVIALLMQPASDCSHFAQFIGLVCDYYQGKGGNEPSKVALKEGLSIRVAYKEFLACQTEGKVIRKNSILVNMIAVYEKVQYLELTGNPEIDWRNIRYILENGVCTRLHKIADDVRNIRVLGRGTQLRQMLTQDWCDNAGYRNALSITRQAFVQLHFSANTKPESGVIVMNMHKAKGKQFDEMIIFEGWPIKIKGSAPYNPHRIVRFNSKKNIDDQTRYNFRVSVTRAKSHTTILTPRTDRCVLLSSELSIG